ncbi:MAG: TIR domain-containing protein [Peptococcaceae bacterium]|nr:TIR domain-containing protein [Peptococcaceae bacterium]
MSEPKYEAFISYRHKDLDSAVARAIHKQLETYRIPRSIQKSSGKQKMGKAFRDQDELPLLADLEEGIQQALNGSEWLIVICTPDFPLSKWCMAEVDYFIALGRRDRILTVLAAGEPEQSFPEQLRYVLIDGVPTEREPLAADVRADSPSGSLKKLKNEKLRLLAPMLGVGYDDLRRRHRERFLRTVAGVSMAAAVASVGAGAYVLRQNQLLTEQRQLAQEQRDEALISQSRFLAELSAQQLAKGDRVTATLLALESLPRDIRDPDRPLVEEAVTALRNSETTASDTGFQPLFTIERAAGAALNSFSRQYRSYHLYENKLFTVGDGAVFIHDVGSGELLGETPLDLLKGQPGAVVFSSVTASVFLVYEDHFQLIYPARDNFSEDFPLAYEGDFIPEGGVAWSGGIVIYGFDETAKYWKFRNSAFLPAAPAIPLVAESPFTCASLSRNSSTYSYLLATGHTAREQGVDTVRIWDASEGSFLRSLPIRDEISFLELSPNRAALAVVTKEGYVSLWNPADALPLYALNEEDQVKPDHYQALEARFSPDSATLAVCYGNGVVRLYDTATGRELRDLRGSGLVLRNVRWSDDGSELLCAAGDQSAYLFEAADGEIKSRLNSFGDLLEAVFLDSDTILLEHTDGALHIFERRDGEASGALAMTGEAVMWDALLSPDGATAVSSTFAGALRVYGTSGGQTLRSDRYPRTTSQGVAQIKTMSWLRDGSGRLLVQGVNEAALWDPAGGNWQFITPARIGDSAAGEVQNASANADATLLALNTRADWVHIHDLAAGAEKVRFRHNPDSPNGLNYVYPLWSPADPDRLLTYRTWDSDPENLIHIWNSRGEKQLSLNMGGDPVKEAAWSPDGQYILCADRAGRLRIYSADGGALAAELAERPANARYCAWSPDGARIAFYADSDRAWIWNWQGEGGVTQIRNPEKHPQSGLPQPSWSPDGTLIYLYSEIYNAASGAEVMALPDAATYSVPTTWTPDSGGVLLKQNRYTARLWSIRPVQELMSDALRRLNGRILSGDERRRFFLE